MSQLWEGLWPWIGWEESGMARALVHIHLHFVHSPMYPVQTIGSGNAPLGADARPVAGVRVWRGDSVGIAVLARSGGLPTG